MGFESTDQILDALLQAGPNWVLNIGGSFDPPHQLHLQIAEASFKQLLSRLLDICKTADDLAAQARHIIIVFMPAKQNTLKSTLVVEPKLRFQMMQALLTHYQFEKKLQTLFLKMLSKRFPDLSSASAEQIVKNCLRIHVATYETNRTAPSYTVDTCCTYREYDTINYLSFALGSDSLVLLPQWHMANDLLRLMDALIVLPRQKDLTNNNKIDDNLSAAHFIETIKSKQTVTDFDFDLLKSRLQVVADFEGSAMSSTALRDCIAAQSLSTVEPAVCPEILEIIQANNLYR